MFYFESHVDMCTGFKFERKLKSLMRNIFIGAIDFMYCRIKSNIPSLALRIIDRRLATRVRGFRRVQSEHEAHQMFRVTRARHNGCYEGRTEIQTRTVIVEECSDSPCSDQTVALT